MNVSYESLMELDTNSQDQKKWITVDYLIPIVS